MKPKQPASALLLVVIGVCMVSYSGPMIKGALMCGASPASVALIRMLAAGLLLLPFELRQCARRHIPFRATRTELAWTLLSAVFLAGHYLTWISSLTATSTFASVALVCTQPLFVALLSYLLFHEIMPRKAVPGALLALLGALIIAMSGVGSGSQLADFSGSLLALAGAVLIAAHWIVSRQVQRTLRAEIYTPLLYLLTACVLAAAIPLMGGFRMPLAALPYMAGLVLGSTLLGHTLFTFALSRVSAGVVSFALLGEPVGAMLFSMLLFHEVPSPLVIVGGGVTLLGLCLYLAFAGRAAQQAESC